MILVNLTLKTALIARDVNETVGCKVKKLKQERQRTGLLTTTKLSLVDA